MADMIQMEFYEGKKEYIEIHYDRLRMNTNQGSVTHVMDICQFRKKRIPSMSTKTKKGDEVANENDHERSLICGRKNIQIECFDLVIFLTFAHPPYRPGWWEPVDYHTRN